jgi:hypothetical protein
VLILTGTTCSLQQWQEKLSMYKEDGYWSYFIIPTLADSSCGLWTEDSATLAIFLLHPEFLLLQLETRKSNTLNQKGTRKRCKTELTYRE